MLHKLLSDSRFFHFLLLIDQDAAAKCQGEDCPRCGSRLDVSHYVRKPRGYEVEGLPKFFEIRFSFCCRRDGCRRRRTPSSLRFLDRRVYLGAVVVVVSAMLHGATPSRAAKIRRLIGAEWHTVTVWLGFWQKLFPVSARGRELRAALSAAPTSHDLFRSLWCAAMDGASRGQVVARRLARLLFIFTRQLTQHDDSLIKEMAEFSFPQRIPTALH